MSITPLAVVRVTTQNCQRKTSLQRKTKPCLQHDEGVCLAVAAVDDVNCAPGGGARDDAAAAAEGIKHQNDLTAQGGGQRSSVQRHATEEHFTRMSCKVRASDSPSASQAPPCVPLPCRHSSTLRRVGGCHRDFRFTEAATSWSRWY